jgi:hypothetical protein
MEAACEHCLGNDFLEHTGLRIVYNSNCLKQDWTGVIRA